MSHQRWLASIGVFLVTAGGWAATAPVPPQALGVFSDSTDVGTPSTIGKGSARFNADRNVGPEYSRYIAFVSYQLIPQ